MTFLHVKTVHGRCLHQWQPFTHFFIANISTYENMCASTTFSAMLDKKRDARFFIKVFCTLENVVHFVGASFRTAVVHSSLLRLDLAEHWHKFDGEALLRRTCRRGYSFELISSPSNKQQHYHDDQHKFFLHGSHFYYVFHTHSSCLSTYSTPTQL